MPERTGPLAGIVLAAGTSSRMGRNKLLLPLEGESLLRRAVRRAAAVLDSVIVVLGHEADRVRPELSGLECVVAVNPDYQSGINLSVRAGLAMVPAAAGAAVVMLADMPFVTSEMIATMVQRYREGTSPLIISDYDGVHGPPMLYDRSLFEELGAMQGEGCGRQVVRKHRDEAIVVRWPVSALTDLDLPDDYERVTLSLGVR